MTSHAVSINIVSFFKDTQDEKATKNEDYQWNMSAQNTSYKSFYEMYKNIENPGYTKSTRE